MHSFYRLYAFNFPSSHSAFIGIKNVYSGYCLAVCEKYCTFAEIFLYKALVRIPQGEGGGALWD